MQVLIRKKPVFATQEIEDKVLAVANQVWQQIGSEILALDVECGEKSTNEGAYESIFDANRPSMFCKELGKEVEALFTEATKKFGYTPVLRAFCRARPLV